MTSRGSSRMSVTSAGNDYQQTMVQCLVKISQEQASQRETLKQLTLELCQFQETALHRLESLQGALNSLSSGSREPVGARSKDYLSQTVLPVTSKPRKPKASRQSPPILNADPPRNVSKPKPKGIRNKQLCDVFVEALPEMRLFKKQLPQEKDFVNLMKALTMDVNKSTIAAVSSAARMEGRVSASPPALDTVLVLDVSASMVGQPLAALKLFVAAFIDGLERTERDLRLQERLAVIICGGTTGIMQQFTAGSQAQLGQLMEQLQAEGKTPLMTALTLALSYVELNGRSVRLGAEVVLHPRVVVISDFNATDDRAPFEDHDFADSNARIKIQKQLIQLSQVYKRQGLGLYCVPVGPDGNVSVAQEMATSSAGGELISERDAYTAGNFLRYNAVISLTFEEYAASVSSDQERSYEEILEDVMPLAGCKDRDKVAVNHALEACLGTGGDMVVIDEELEAPPAPPPRLCPPGEEDMPPWKPTRSLEQFGFEEDASLPPLGTRVSRGQDWNFDNTDGGQPGTIIAHVREKVALVMFDNEYIGMYRMGLEDKWDVVTGAAPRSVPQGHLEVGCPVKRGPDWKRKNEDGGAGKVGVVIRKQRARYVMVRWPARVIDSYRFGTEGKFDVVVTDEPPQFEVDDQAVNQAAAQQDDVPKQPWWKWRDRQSMWRPLTREAVEELEAKLQTSQEKALIQYKGKSMKIFLKENKCEIDNEKYDIEREMITEEEVMSLMEMDKFLPPI
ncbi:uncharacterized protein LOC128228927 [Mya arenaria]|uniref:uncharacterized protein LOC128228927 n=1 Tax=Mya arenaria TaxID=6604 RepID=UPI0022E70743|nr:uncharacterized protein LOC128228927 [Mya arenaria]XP_052796446.1 uncharacterized protein LOC128228927 [Mya arenaria]XP_052796447.1 uncharacterized protein LOC128228927 [Mya arenaria]